MIDLLITTDAEYIRRLTSSHVIRTRIQILDRNELVVSDLTNDPRVYIVSGAVQVDVGGDVSRQLAIGLIDPFGVAMLDPDAPSTSALFMDRYVKVFYDVFMGDGTWKTCPVFTGPITKLEQNGANISLEAMGKESLLLAPALQWKTRRFRKGTKITSVIHALLSDHGERRIKMPSLSRRLHKDMTVVGVDEPWKIIQKLAKEVDRQAFYDGDGYFRMRRFPSDSVYTFEVGVDVLTTPSMPLDFTTLRNTIRVMGPEPDQKKARRISGTATLTAANALSPGSLGRNGKRRVLGEVIDADHIKKNAEARNQAKKVLARASVLSSDMTFDALVIPFLEEYDPVRVISPQGTYRFAMRSFTIPLLASDSMSVGYLKRSRVRRIHRVKKVA